MICEKCGKGVVEIQASYKRNVVYSPRLDGEGYKIRMSLTQCTDVNALCSQCQTAYSLDEYRFRSDETIKITGTMEKVKVELQKGSSIKPSVILRAEDQIIHELIQNLGWKEDDIINSIPPILGTYEKHYKSSMGADPLNQLSQDEASTLINETEKALSDNQIPYHTKILSLE